MMDDEGRGEILCREDELDFQDRHWMSYSLYRGPRDVLNGQICVISVVLDAGAHTSFSGIRTLIVGEVTEDLNKVRIKDWLENPYIRRNPRLRWPTDLNWPPQPRRPSHRTNLARSKIANEQSKTLLESNANTNDPDTFLPPCTVVFELVDTSNESWSSVGLTLRNGGFSPRRPLRVIYDHAVLCTPRQRSATAILRLSSNHSFIGIHKITATGLLPRLPSGTPTHCIRILPLSSRRSLPNLPAKVIRRIADHAFSRRDQHFRSSLLSFALVCKAWSPLIDIFYESLGTPYLAEDRPVASSVSRALNKKPEKAKLIKSFSPWDYLGDGGDKQLFHLSEAHMGILTLATAMKGIHVSSIQPALVGPFLNAISNLPDIERFTVNHPMPVGALDNPDSIESQPKQYLEISDILNILPHWENLRILHITQHKISERKGIHTERSELESGTRPVHNCKIEELYFQNGYITGFHLLQFISPSQSTLTRAELNGLHGLSNRDLISFFSQVSSTVKSITISGCAVSHNADDKDYVFDVIMHKMISLQYALIEGPNLASLLAITDKPQSDPMETAGWPRQISVELAAPCQIDVDKVFGALQVTGWRSIRLVHPSFSEWSTEQRGRVYEAARKRDINIELFYMVSPLSP